jgi:uncharacterized alkaline shock family protein YloU
MSKQVSHPNARVLPDGKIEVVPRAIATITARTVLQCYGVVGMSLHNVREGLAQILHKEDQYKGIDILIKNVTVQVG